MVREVQSYGRNLLGEVNGLGDLNDTSLDGALEVDVADLLAEVGLGADQANEAILDGKEDVGVLFDSGLDLALGLDDELMATVDSMLAGSSSAKRKRFVHTPWGGWGRGRPSQSRRGPWSGLLGRAGAANRRGCRDHRWQRDRGHCRRRCSARLPGPDRRRGTQRR